MNSLLINQLPPTTINIIVRESGSAISRMLPLLIEKFNKKEEGMWITSNCQHIQMDGVNYYGIHKNEQLLATYAATRELYQKMKLHVLQNMGMSSNCEIVQVVGGCSAFSREGTERAKDFLRAQISPNCVILYGYTGTKEQNGAMCDVNAAVADVAEELNMLDQTIANVVGFDTPRALTEWGSLGAALKHFVIVYGDDESSEVTGTLFGDDVITSDFFADKLLMLDGGVQSFRQACHALLLNQKVIALSGVKAEGKSTYFIAVQFLRQLAQDLLERGEADPEEYLKQWFSNYFRDGKCYVCDPKKRTFATKQKQLEVAWDLFLREKLYLKIDELITFSA